MKRIVVIVLCCFTWGIAMVNGQAVPETIDIPVVYAHAVYRHDGSVFKGEITEWNVDFIKLRLLSGLEITLQTDEIRKVISRNVPRPTMREKRSSFDRVYQFREKGMYHVTTTALSAGPAAGLGVTHAVGYRFSRLLGIGAGIGAESFDLGSGNQVAPLFAEARGFLSARNISPYYAVRGGYGFALKNGETSMTQAKGGVLLSVELGYRFGGARAVNFFTGVGVHFQNATYTYAWPWEGRIIDEISHRRTELRVGVIF